MVTESHTTELTPRDRVSSHISVSNLVWTYPKDRLDFELRVPVLDVLPGTSTACTGPSGSGKSTLLQIVAGILWPAQGRVVVGPLDLSADASPAPSDATRRAFRIQHIGMVFQEFALLDHLTVEENILLPYAIHRVHKKTPDALKRARALADQVGIANHLHRYPAWLSQGERQRVAVCRAVVTHPQVLLADEPTGNLDPDTSDVIVEVLLNEVRTRGASLIMATHDVSRIASFDSHLALDKTSRGAEKAT